MVPYDVHGVGSGIRCHYTLMLATPFLSSLVVFGLQYHQRVCVHRVSLINFDTPDIIFRANLVRNPTTSVRLTLSSIPHHDNARNTPHTHLCA